MQNVSLMFSSRALSAAIALPFSAPTIYSYFILRFRIRLSLCSASARAISILLSLFSNNFSDTVCLISSSWVTGCGMKGSWVGGVGGKGFLVEGKWGSGMLVFEVGSDMFSKWAME